MTTHAPRQAARIAFGLALAAGAFELARQGLEHPGERGPAAHILEWTWLAALAAAAVVRVAAAFVRRPVRDPARLLHASVVIPAVGLALVLPLSLHLVWFVIVDRQVTAFDDWVNMSVVFTGFAHLVFALCAGFRASQLARGREPISVSAIFVLCVVAGSLPFPVLPSLYIAVTGLPIIPLLFAMQPLVARERAALPVLPLAIAE